MDCILDLNYHNILEAMPEMDNLIQFIDQLRVLKGQQENYT